MKRWLVWVIGVGLVVAAWAVVQVTPDDNIAEAPFTVPAATGERAAGRTIAVEVTGARLGDAATDGGWRAEGTWLVVDLTAEAVGSAVGTILGGASLEIDGATYRASERPTSMLRTALTPGIPRTGSIAFELPPDLTEAAGMLRLSADSEIRVDSLIEVPIDLGAVSRAPEVELLRTDWTNS